MRIRLRPDQRKALILLEAVKLLRDTGVIDMAILCVRCRCARSTIIYHFGSTDKIRQVAIEAVRCQN